MKWSADENAGRQSVMFDLMLGDVVAPLERVAPSERAVQVVVVGEDGAERTLTPAEVAAMLDAAG